METRRYLVHNQEEKRRGEIGYKILQRPSESEKYYCVGIKMRRTFRTRYLTMKESVDEVGGVVTIVSSR